MANDPDVTEMVATWLVNESDPVDYKGTTQRIAEHAQQLARAGNVDELRTFTTNILRSSRTYSSAREVADELSRNDYDRIDWAEIAHQLALD